MQNQGTSMLKPSKFSQHGTHWRDNHMHEKNKKVNQPKRQKQQSKHGNMLHYVRMHWGTEKLMGGERINTPVIASITFQCLMVKCICHHPQSSITKLHWIAR